jgi:hypothetical protein
MKRVCPNPIPWKQAFERLTTHAKCRRCTPASPPTPLILAGWAYTNDEQKMRRWIETLAWANANGCAEMVNEIPDADFYFVDNPSKYAIGPLGGPMYRRWDFDAKDRPSPETLDRYLETLVCGWTEIIREELGRVTRPLAFAGKKARRLVVYADSKVRPSWGEWHRLSHLESERRAFTVFRSAINKAIAPHEIDHADFTTEPERIGSA